MALKVFVDIETLPPDERVAAKLRLENCVKILANNGSKTATQKLVSSIAEDISSYSVNALPDDLYRRLSLCGEYGRVLAIGVIIEKDGKVCRKGVFGYDPDKRRFHLDEAKTLRGFWKLIKNFNIEKDLIIGHNLMDFDLPFLVKRSRITHTAPTVNFSFARYRSQPIYDTMKEWSLWNTRETFLSLMHLAELLDIGISKTDGMDGSKVYDEFMNGSHELIHNYCLQDVEVTRAVFHRISSPELGLCP
jgi:hypothetical protein